MAAKNPHRLEAVLAYPSHWFDPEDLMTFIESNLFRGSWKRLSLTDEQLFELQVAIMSLPRGAPVVKGTGGLRKLRFSPESENVGKSGSYRVCYVHFEEYSVVLLVLAYAKNEDDDLSPEGKKAIRRMIREQHALLSRGPIR